MPWRIKIRKSAELQTVGNWRLLAIGERVYLDACKGSVAPVWPKVVLLDKSQVETVRKFVCDLLTNFNYFIKGGRYCLFFVLVCLQNFSCFCLFCHCLFTVRWSISLFLLVSFRIVNYFCNTLSKIAKSCTQHDQISPVYDCILRGYPILFCNFLKVYGLLY